MILRSVMQHIRDQNWTAVCIDFVIVVVGVFMGIQVNNWNEARQADAREVVVLKRLTQEFNEIHGALERQIEHRRAWADRIATLIEVLERDEEAPDDNMIRVALHAATASGRRPAQSASYLQLMASGDLASLSNAELQKSLIDYHSRLDRDAEYYIELVRLAVDDVATNESVDRTVTQMQRAGAAIDQQGPADLGSTIRSFDLAGLQKYETRYEAIYLLNRTILDAEERQLKHVEQILAALEESVGQ